METSPVNWYRTVLVGAFAPPLLGAGFFLYATYRSGIEPTSKALLVFIVFAYWLVALVGIPLVMTLKKQRIVSLKAHVLAGIIVSIALMLLLFLFAHQPPPIVEVLVFGVFGASAGVASWYIVRE